MRTTELETVKIGLPLPDKSIFVKSVDKRVNAALANSFELSGGKFIFAGDNPGIVEIQRLRRLQILEGIQDGTLDLGVVTNTTFYQSQRPLDQPSFVGFATEFRFDIGEFSIAALDYFKARQGMQTGFRGMRVGTDIPNYAESMFRKGDINASSLVYTGNIDLMVLLRTGALDAIVRDMDALFVSRNGLQIVKKLDTIRAELIFSKAVLDGERTSFASTFMNRLAQISAEISEEEDRQDEEWAKSRD